MSATDVSVCNGALVKLGADMIVSLDDDSRQAKLCKEQYSKNKRELLRSHPWNFAIRRASLAASVAAPEFGYAYKFPLPANCLRVLEVNENLYEWEREGNDIVTDASVCEIKYIEDVGEEYFDDNFANSLSLKIASDLSGDLNPAMKTTLYAEYSESVRAARAFDAQESRGGKLRTTTFTSSRR